MATRLGVAYVDVEPDFSAFDRLVAKKLGRSFTAVGEQSGRDFTQGFNDRASGVLVPIAAGLRNVARDSASANAGIRGTDKALEAVSRTAARAAKSLGKFDGSRALAARSAANKAKDATDSAARRTSPVADISPVARADAKLAAADAEIKAITAHLAELQAVPEPSLEVEVKIGKALAALEAVEARKTKLTAERADIQVGLDQASVNRVFAALNGLRDVTKLPSVVPSPPGAALADLNERIGRSQNANPFARDGGASFGASKALDGTTASARTAAEAVAGVAAEVAALADLTPTARLDLKIEAADDEILALRAKLAALTAGAQTVEVRADVVEAITALERVEAAKRRLTAQRATIQLDADESAVGTLRRIAQAASQAATSLGGGGGLGGVTTRVSAGFLSFGASLGPVAIALAAVAATIAVAVVGALAALAASAAAAAAGVAVLAAAVAGVLGPAVILAVAVIARLVAVFGALKAQDAAADAVGRGAAAGAQAAAAAADQQAAAARGLTEANRQLGRATAAAYREMEDAAESASDAIRDLEQAKLSREQADLNTDKAIADLAELRAELGATGDAFNATFDKFTDVAVDTSGLREALSVANAATGGNVSDADTLKLRQAILDVRQARLSEKEAIDGVSDAETARARAQQRANEFAKQGIDASEGYSAALRGVEAASLAVVAAQRNQGADLLAAQTKALDLTNDLSNAERRLLDAFKRVRDELRGAFKSATDAAFRGIAVGVENVSKIINPLRGAFTTLGGAIGRAFANLTGEFIDPDWTRALRQFTNAGARIATVFTSDILIPFLRIVRDLGVAALPALERGLGRVGDLFRGLASDNGPRELSGVVAGVVSHLRSWVALTGQVSRVFLAFARAAAGEGQGLVDTLTQGARRLADFASSAAGQERIKEFFANVVPLAKEFVKLLGLLILGAVKFAEETAPAFAKVLGVVNTIVGALNKVGGAFKVLSLGNPAGVLSDLFKRVGEDAKGSAQTVASAMAQAAASVKRADDDLADSQRSAAQAQRDLTSARRDGERQLADLASASANAELGRKSAVLDLSDAREQLAQDKASGKTGDDLARSRLRVAEAEQRVRDATRDAHRAQEENAAAQKAGVKGTDSYKAAKDRLADANKRVEASEGAAAAAVVAGQRAITEARLNAKREEPTDGGLGGVVTSVNGAIGQFAVDAFDGGVDLAVSVAEGVVSAAGSVGTAIGGAVSSAVNTASTFRGQMLGQGRRLLLSVVEGIAGVASRVASVVTRAITDALAAIDAMLGRVRGAGASIGRAIVSGIRSGLEGLAGIGKTILNALVGVLNAGMRIINNALPDKLDIPGAPNINLPDNPLPNIPRFQRGGPIPGTGFGDKVHILAEPQEFMIQRKITALFGPTVFADINDGRLDPRVGYQDGQRPSVSVTTNRSGMFATGGLVAQGTAAVAERPNVTNNITAPITVPGDGPPDPVALAVALARTLESRGGSPRN